MLGWLGYLTLFLYYVYFLYQMYKVELRTCIFSAALIRLGSLDEIAEA